MKKINNIITKLNLTVFETLVNCLIVILQILVQTGLLQLRGKTRDGNYNGRREFNKLQKQAFLFRLLS